MPRPPTSSFRKRLLGGFPYAASRKRLLGGSASFKIRRPRSPNYLLDKEDLKASRVIEKCFLDWNAACLRRRLRSVRRRSGNSDIPPWVSTFYLQQWKMAKEREEMMRYEMSIQMELVKRGIIPVDPRCVSKIDAHSMWHDVVFSLSVFLRSQRRIIIHTEKDVGALSLVTKEMDFMADFDGEINIIAGYTEIEQLKRQVENLGLCVLP